MKALAVFVSTVLMASPAFAQYRAGEPPAAGERSEQKGHEVKQAAKDSALTAKVHTALAADVGLKTLKIDVDSDASSGTVTLKGRVDSADTKQRAEAVAKRVEGVKSVDNQLTVGEPKG